MGRYGRGYYAKDYVMYHELMEWGRNSVGNFKERKQALYEKLTNERRRQNLDEGALASLNGVPPCSKTRKCFLESED